MENEYVKNTKKTKIFIIAAIILIIAVIGVTIIKLTGNKKIDNEIIKKFNSDSLIAVKKDKMYGYIDTEGNIKIEPQYKYAKDFDGDYAIVGVSDDNNKMLYEIIDTLGNVKASTSNFSSIKKNKISGYWEIDNKLYDESFKLATTENIERESNGYYSYNNSETKESGIINPYGKKTYTYNLKNDEHSFIVYASTINKYQKNRYCSIVVSAKKYAIVNCETGKVIYDFAEKESYPLENNVFTIRDNQSKTYVFIDDDKIAYETSDNNISLKNKDDRDFGYMVIEDRSQSGENKYKYFLYNSKEIVSELPKDEIEINYSNAWEEYTKIKKYSCDNGYGLKKDEKIIVPCEWSTIEFFNLDNYLYLLSNNKNYIMTKKDDKVNIYDINKNKLVKELNTNRITQNYDSFLLEYKDKDTGLTTIYNPMTNKEMTVDKGNITYKSNYFYVINNGKKDYYNMNYRLIYSEQ